MWRGVSSLARQGIIKEGNMPKKSKWSGASKYITLKNFNCPCGGKPVVVKTVGNKAQCRCPNCGATYLGDMPNVK
jgi:transcription elongation factor Elf1